MSDYPVEFSRLEEENKKLKEVNKYISEQNIGAAGNYTRICKKAKVLEEENKRLKKQVELLTLGLLQGKYRWAETRLYVGEETGS